MWKDIGKTTKYLKKLNASTMVLIALVLVVPGFDFDDDGLSTYSEFVVYKTDAFNPYSDFDHILDNLEITTYFSNPNLVDSDSDGLTDGDEINRYGTNPSSHDTDNDGLDDKYELTKSLTNVTNADTDNDGLIDGSEVKIHKTDPLDRDSDNDRLEDGYELIPKAIGASGGATVECDEGYYVGSNPLHPNTYGIAGGDIKLADPSNSCIKPFCGRITKREGYCE